MHRAALFFSWRRAGAVASLWMGLLLGGAAHAALVGSVTVSLIAPGGLTADLIVTPISVSDTVSPLASAIAPGDATNIGSYMLPTEFIGFVGDSIRIRTTAGDINTAGAGITGYLGSGSDPARYEFTGLAITGKDIIGIQAYAFDGFLMSGTLGLAIPSGGALADYFSFDDVTDMVSVNLSDLVFAARTGGQSVDFADLRIDLVTRDTDGPPPTNVPEPTTAALIVVALLGLRSVRVRRPA